MSKTDLFELQDWLKDIKVPSDHSVRKSFLSIVGLDHYENIWSNIYAYFLRQDEDHGLKDIFIRGLTRI